LQQRGRRLGQGGGGILVDGGAHFDLAALQTGGQQGAQRGFLGAQLVGQAEGQVQETAVDRADFQPSRTLREDASPASALLPCWALA
jgi:hypothetical protein